ncbi:unnamed protein product [Onchocerca flexuosa]|uniref:Ovule protein n=1 Tax=Onchocerca flexuosa TaxID=387005 RepID=A0A183I0D9_9BILA|nr:unnamed protein product [Onchocerca flexuosa]
MCSFFSTLLEQQLWTTSEKNNNGPNTVINQISDVANIPLVVDYLSLICFGHPFYPIVLTISSSFAFAPLISSPQLLIQLPFEP